MLSLKINKNIGVLRKGFAVRKLAVLPEDLGLIPSTHMVRNNHP